MRAVRKYQEFHGRDPRRISSFHDDFAIPAEVAHVGRAVRVMYRSDKLNPSTGEDEGWIDYFHDHHDGVNLYRCDARANGAPRAVPAWLRNVRELTCLGYNLGVEYKEHDGRIVAVDATKPLPELFCTPNGRALLIVQGRRRLLCMMWGGRLGVEPRGIVH